MLEPKYKNREWLFNEYINKGKSTTEIGSDIDISYSTIRNWLIKHKITIRKSGVKGMAHYRWKGGRTEVGQYIYILMPEHSRANIIGYVYEHLLIAEKVLGRPLKYYGKNNSKNELVHHIDGNKKNNAESNLYIMNRNNHSKCHNSLTDIGFKFLKKGLIGFKNGEYYIV